jgi:CYTH domain-containing protein
MIERERKFQLKEMPDYVEKLDILQAYLIIDGSTQLRVRITESLINGIAHICYKTKISDTDKHEYEYKIPVSDALELYESAKYKLKKIRYVVNNDIIIDEYPDHNNLRIVEIEYNTDTLENIPDYCGEDVTNNFEYSNFKLAGYK